MKNILNKKFEELTFEDQMVLALKGALEKFKESDNEEEKTFYGAFIAHTQMELKEMGVDAFEYKII